MTKTVKIGYRTYTIETMPAEFKDANKYFGYTCHADSRICMLAGRKKQDHANTLFHEILHCLFYQYGMQEIVGQDEEYIVNTLSNAISTFITDNPDVMKEITEDLNNDSDPKDNA